MSEVLEELYHAEQWKDGRLVDEPVSKIKAEIEAQNYLLSVSKRYNIPRNEIEQTKNNLKYWKEELKNMKIKAITQAPFGTIVSLDKPISGALGGMLTTDDTVFHKIKGTPSDIWTEFLVDKTDLLKVDQEVKVVLEGKKVS